jgi:hypothetical protein
MLKVDPAGRVHVYVSVTDTTDVTLDVLRSHDLEIEIVNDEFRIVQGWIPVEQLEVLAGEPGVLKIRPPSYGMTNAGSITAQGGDAAPALRDVLAGSLDGLRGRETAMWGEE